MLLTWANSLEIMKKGNGAIRTSPGGCQHASTYFLFCVSEVHTQIRSQTPPLPKPRCTARSELILSQELPLGRELRDARERHR